LWTDTEIRREDSRADIILAELASVTLARQVGSCRVFSTTFTKETIVNTRDGLKIYDLEPLASELWIVAGPPGHKIAEINPDDLPPGFRWVEEDEWADLQEDAPIDILVRFNPEGEGHLEAKCWHSRFEGKISWPTPITPESDPWK
jgi:hypothetical protein